MRKVIALVVLLAAKSALAGETNEVLVSHTTPTRIPIALNTRRAQLLENRGPNSIYCGYSASITTAKAHLVAPGAWREFPSDVLWCIAATATQVTTAATVVSEV